MTLGYGFFLFYLAWDFWSAAILEHVSVFLSLLWLDNIPLDGYTSLCIHSSVNEHAFCFYLFIVVNNASGHASICQNLFSIWGIGPGLELFGQILIPCFISRGRVNLAAKVTYTFLYFHQQPTGFQFLHIHAKTFSPLGGMMAIKVGIQWFLIVVFICPSLTTHDAELSIFSHAWYPLAYLHWKHVQIHSDIRSMLQRMRSL